MHPFMPIGMAAAFLLYQKNKERNKKRNCASFEESVKPSTPDMARSFGAFVGNALGTKGAKVVRRNHSRSSSARVILRR